MIVKPNNKHRYLIAWQSNEEDWKENGYVICVVDILPIDKPFSWDQDKQYKWRENGNQFSMQEWYSLAVNKIITFSEFEERFNTIIPYPEDYQ